MRGYMGANKPKMAKRAPVAKTVSMSKSGKKPAQKTGAKAIGAPRKTSRRII